MTQRLTPRDISARKNAEKIVVASTYTAPLARAFDPHVDMLMVGDSVGMVLYGLPSTLPVTLEMMLLHGAAVVRASAKASVVVDLPFGSYQASCEQAFAAAARILKETGAGSVKLEGGREMEETIRFLTQRGVPVMAHIGLMPQHYNATGFRMQGRSEDERQKIMEDALAIKRSGAYAVVLESVREDIAREVTEMMPIPTIGIGASPACDGQVLVAEDMLGLSGMAPKFVKLYADLGAAADKAAEAFAKEVRSGKFPGKEHCFTKNGVKSPIPI